MFVPISDLQKNTFHFMNAKMINFYFCSNLRFKISLYIRRDFQALEKITHPKLPTKTKNENAEFPGKGISLETLRWANLPCKKDGLKLDFLGFLKHYFGRKLPYYPNVKSHRSGVYQFT